MPFIGNKPSAVPLTSADIADGIITSAKIVDATITNSDVASSIITGQTAETSIAGGDSILIYDDSATALRKMTRTNFVSGIGGTNTPAFSAKPTSNQTITANTWTKVDLGTENLDTDGNFASSRFTPTTSGYYFINLIVSTNNANTYLYGNIYKNGSALIGSTMSSVSGGGASVCAIIQLNGSSDYIEAYTFQGTSNGNAENTNTQFSGFKLIGA
jgi:hypothetical protein